MPPRVSIIIPCYNEQATIRQLLEAIYHQTYPRAEMEVVIADGLSEDATRDEIAAFQNEHPELTVRIVDNTGRTIPSAINCAIQASIGETIIRMDAHSRPYPDYVERCLLLLMQAWAIMSAVSGRSNRVAKAGSLNRLLLRLRIRWVWAMPAIVSARRLRKWILFRLARSVVH